MSTPTTTEGVLLALFELVAEEVLKLVPQADVMSSLDRAAAKVTRAAGEAALAAKFPDE